MNDLNQIKAAIEAGVEIRKVCGIPLTLKEHPGMVFNDGNEAVGEITVPTDDGPIPIPVCAEHLQQIADDYRNKLVKE